MPLAITTTSLPLAFLNVPYSQGLAATGGTPVYTWTLSAGALPAGLSLSAAGVISGTPGSKSGGSYSFTVKVTDSLAATATQNLVLAVNFTIVMSCSQCGFYQTTSNMNIANLIVAAHLAGWGPAHVVVKGGGG